LVRGMRFSATPSFRRLAFSANYIHNTKGYIKKGALALGSIDTCFCRAVALTKTGGFGSTPGRGHCDRGMFFCARPLKGVLAFKSYIFGGCTLT